MNDLERIRELKRQIKLAEAEVRKVASQKYVHSNLCTDGALVSQDDMKKVLSLLATDMKDCRDFYAAKGLFKTSKQLSEDVSGLFETRFEQTIPNAKAPKKEKLSDLLVEDVPAEVKVTTCLTGWRGGEYSKRSSYYFLISWEEVEGNIHLFVAGTHLHENDWVSSKPRKAKGDRPKGEKNYYATTFDKKKLVEKLNDGSLDIYHGSVITYCRGTQSCIKIERERV